MHDCNVLYIICKHLREMYSLNSFSDLYRGKLISTIFSILCEFGIITSPWNQTNQQNNKQNNKYYALFLKTKILIETNVLRFTAQDC